MGPRWDRQGLRYLGAGFSATGQTFVKPVGNQDARSSVFVFVKLGYLWGIFKLGKAAQTLPPMFDISLG